MHQTYIIELLNAERIIEMDSYELFIEKLGINFDDFLEFGIENTIYPDQDRIAEFWEELKNRITSGKTVYVRGLGRNGNGNEILKDFYSHFGINVEIDPTNNAIPQRNLQHFTSLIRNQNLFNYQVAHIFGCTKNVYMFESPWNVCFVPKLIDPLTGHESKGKFSDEYKKRWLKGIIQKHKTFIDDYNHLIDDFDIDGKLSVFLADDLIKQKYTKEQLDSFKKNITKEFVKIE